MKSAYKRLNRSHRIEIEKLIALGKNKKQIASTLSVHPSTISRELKRVKNGPYNYSKAELDYVNNLMDKRYGKTKIEGNPKLKNFVYSHLKLHWSPQQISDALKQFYPFDSTMQISHESIYYHIYIQPKKEVEKLLISQLRQKRKYRGNVRRGTDKRTTIKDPIRIDERPENVLTREVPGHWEGDLILGKNRESAIGTLVERTTRFLIMVPLKKRDATSVRKAFEKAFSNIPKHLKLSLTYDNGTEMAQHKLFTKNSKVKVYFAHPYSPWERPTNENTNGLIRDYFPKGTDFNLLSKKDIVKVQNQLNERPRKTLEYESPLNAISRLYMNQNFI
ncbi:IS30 family transposase [Flavobacterium suncheonense]|uniref:IS30 family transposase n=2 Tax=Flavobacterium suncheonense TaxID=350894 RepID=UPI000426735B|nr:IS30 family transposase [Flavobacterium suncheonense]